MQAPDADSGVYETEAVIDNGRFGKRSIRYETGRLAKQAAAIAVQARRILVIGRSHPGLTAGQDRLNHLCVLHPPTVRPLQASTWRISA